METIYLICAAVGGTFIVCQFVMTLFGLGGGHDMAGDHGGHDFGGHDVGHGHDAAGDHHEVGHGNESTWFMGLLTIRTVTAGIAFFGLVGYIMETRMNIEPIPAALVALAAGVAALVLVGYVMKGIGRLNVDGTIRINKALGCNGTVYIPIPTDGAGKVQVSVLNRTVEYRATAKEALPTGAKITVVAIVGADTVEVAPAQ